MSQESSNSQKDIAKPAQALNLRVMKISDFSVKFFFRVFYRIDLIGNIE